MKARFYINESTNSKFEKARKNFETIINAAFLSKGYNKNFAVYELLGEEYETVVKHLKTTIIKYDYRKRYKLIKIVKKYDTIQELAKSYNYKNLKLEKLSN